MATIAVSNSKINEISEEFGNTGWAYYTGMYFILNIIYSYVIADVIIGLRN